MKVVTIVGARPQFIKAASLSREFVHYPDIQEVLIHTGQHFDYNMSEVFFKELNLPAPDFFLNVNRQNHGAMTGQMLEKIETLLIKEKPDWVVVFGDTNSTLAGALAAKKLHLKLAHVEAGLRSYNNDMPEEINRILTDRISDVLFCPSQEAIDNLSKEGFELIGSKIVLSGDIMKDSVKYCRQFSEKPKFEIPDSFVLATVHRAENVNHAKRLRQIFEAFDEITTQIPVVLPLHPGTHEKLLRLGIKLDRIKVIDPVSYLTMIWLLEHCKLVMTDSGGLQKEAYFFEKACITLRDETEWTELVQNGFNKIAGADKNTILKAFVESKDLLLKEVPELYGNGKAASIIVESLLTYSTTLTPQNAKL